MQGFLFCRAVPADEFQRWLQTTVLPRQAPWIGPSVSAVGTFDLPAYGGPGRPKH